MYLPHVGALGLLNPVQSLNRGGQVHWRIRCSKYAQTSGDYVVGGVLTIARNFHLGQETWLDIVVGPLGMG